MLKNIYCFYLSLKSESEKISIDIKDKPTLSLEGIFRQEDFLELCNKEFTKLKWLILSKNDLIDISPLKDLKAPNLRKIDLSNNQIKNITDNNNSSKYYNFPQLEELDLSYNMLTNIYDLKAFNTPKLKIIDISFNNFNDNNLTQNIDIFKYNFNFPILSKFNNLQYSINKKVSNSIINDKIIESQINNAIVSSYKLNWIINTI